MAKFKITQSTTVAKLKEQFRNEVGGVLRIYEGRSEAADGATLVSLGAKKGELECRTNRTVGKFEEAFQNELNLKVKVYTKDNWVKVLDGITLATAAELPNGMTKAKMEEYLSYQRDEKESGKQSAPAKNNEAPKSGYPTYEEFAAKYPAGHKGDRYKISEDGKRMYEISDSFEGSLIVPEGIEVVEFEYNDRIEGLTAIVMPDSVKEMRGWFNCNYTENLKALRLSPNMKLSQSAFYSLDMEELTIPEGITFIPIEAFKYSKLKKVTLPSTLEFILPQAFGQCQLEEVVIPENVKVVFPGAFYSNSALKKVTFLSPDTRVMKGAFEDCDELPDEASLYEGRELGDFTYGEDELVYGEVEEKNWRGEVKDVRFELIYVPEYFCGPLRIKDGVKSYPDIEDYVGITELYIPDSVEERYPHIPAGVRKVRFPDALEIVSLDKKPNLIEFNWPASAKEFRISEAPFDSLIVPEGVEEVYIDNMPNLSELKLPETLRQISISDLPKIKRCVIPDNVNDISSGSLSDCPLLEEIVLPANLNKIPYRFASGGWRESAKLSKVVIPDSVETIGDRAFSDLPELTRIVIPASVKMIEADAFSRCPNLNEVIIEGAPLVFPGAFEDAPGYKGDFVELATTEKTDSGLPFLKMTVEQIFFKKREYDDAYDFLDSDANYGDCIAMESRSADQAEYPLDKIGYLNWNSSTADALCDFHDDDEDACDSMLGRGYYLVAHPEDADIDYGSTIFEKTASALALILNPESGFTSENNPYEGPEAVVELNIRNFEEEEILHTYRYHLLEKDGEWVAEKL